MTRGDILGVTANTAELLTLGEQYGLPLPRAMGLVYRGWALAYSGERMKVLNLRTEGAGLLERGHSDFSVARLRHDRRNPFSDRKASGWSQ